MKAPWLLSFGFVIACGSSQKKPEPAPTTDTPATTAPAAGPVDCDEACTQYGVCYEEEYGGEFHGGGECTSSCNEMSETDRQAWGAKINAGDCHALFTEP